MNKKIKVIDLIDKKYHNLELPKNIIINRMRYYYDDEIGTYYDENKERMTLDFFNGVLNMEVEILEDNIEEIEELNAYKLMESPYMANLLKEQRYDTFMELLKQSEVEIADKLIKLTWAVKEIRKDLNK